MAPRNGIEYKCPIPGMDNITLIPLVTAIPIEQPVMVHSYTLN